MLNKETVKEIRRAVSEKTVGIIGDFCVDIYWHADMKRSELSRETPHFPLPVTRERIYPGAGGNVAANVAALAPKKTFALSLTGEDWRGALLKEKLAEAGIDASYIVKDADRFTNAYCKPLRSGISAVTYEDPRIDFDNFTPLSSGTEELILRNLEEMAKKCDVICVADQFRFGCVSPRVREMLKNLSAEITVVADSRYNIGEFSGCILKPNEIECWRAVYGNDGWNTASPEDFETAADMLAGKCGSVVFCTLGERGSYLTDGKKGVRSPAVSVEGEVDICGAGDTSLAAFCCALAAGASYEDAVQLAAAASAVTVKKIGITGTACFDEILSVIG